MKIINKIGKKLSAGINFIFDVAEYVARLALVIGLIMYFIGLLVQSKVLETYSLLALVGAALFMIPALIADIEYHTKQIERLEYMMFYGVYDKDDE